MSVTSATEVDVCDASYTTTEVDNVARRVKNEKSRWDNRRTKRESRHRDNATTIEQRSHFKWSSVNRSDSLSSFVLWHNCNEHFASLQNMIRRHWKCNCKSFFVRISRNNSERTFLALSVVHKFREDDEEEEKCGVEKEYLTWKWPFMFLMMIVEPPYVRCEIDKLGCCNRARRARLREQGKRYYLLRTTSATATKRDKKSAFSAVRWVRMKLADIAMTLIV